MDNYTIDADRFAATMEQLLGDYAVHVEEGAGTAVRKAAQVGRKTVKKNARNTGPHGGLEITGDYIKGWSFKVKKTPEGWSAEVGNKDKPGLAHLLEKGHAKVGGGRVQGYEHIADAADKAFDELIEQIQAEVGSL